MHNEFVRILKKYGFTDDRADRIDLDVTIGDEYAVVTVDAHTFKEGMEGLFYRRQQQ